jgi:hypothetical protein
MAADGDEDEEEEDLTAELQLVPAEEAAGELSQTAAAAMAVLAILYSRCCLSNNEPWQRCMQACAPIRVAVYACICRRPWT